MEITAPNGDKFDIVRTIVGRGSITRSGGRYVIFETSDDAIIGRVSWFNGDELKEEFYSDDDALGFFETEFPAVFHEYVKKLEVSNE